jgi:YrbI family 3-deoxy-D-manno-octulosonate 8-phosphate phosphatase
MPIAYSEYSQQHKDRLLKLAKEIQMIVFDFDGVFTDNRVLVLQDGTEAVLCSRADGFGLDAVRNHGIKLLVLSKEKNSVVSARCNKLNIPCIQGYDNKSDILKREADSLRISLKNVAYMGNDINDLECLQIVGLPVCVSDAYPDIVKISLYVTEARGGYGAVREFCDFISNAKAGKIY